MLYADVDLGGLTYAYKKDFLKRVENSHQYYMPNHSGMCDGPYWERQADHWVYIRTESEEAINNVIRELQETYTNTMGPGIYYRDAKDSIYGRDDKTYETLEYETQDYIGQEYHPGLQSSGSEEE